MRLRLIGALKKDTTNVAIYNINWDAMQAPLEETGGDLIEGEIRALTGADQKNGAVAGPSNELQ
jgi:hypothetical protein